MVFVASTPRAWQPMALALAHSRGLLDYEERVCTYWPEFAQQGKEKVTVRQLLSHQAGLLVLDAFVDKMLSPISIDLAAAPGSTETSLGAGHAGKPITPSRSAFTRASCCAESTHSTVASGSSSGRDCLTARIRFLYTPA